MLQIYVQVWLHGKRFGENQLTISTIATFVKQKCLVFQGKTSIILNIQRFLQQQPVSQGEGLPVPATPSNWEERKLPILLKTTKNGLLLFEQAELNDLVRNLHLSKDHAELLGSSLQQWNLLVSETKVTIFRK